MRKLLIISISTLFLTLIFSFNSSSDAKTVQEIIEEKCNKSIFTKIKCKTDEYNLSPTDYFKKRKRCSRYRDQADTVYKGKQIYKRCMEQYR